MYRSNNTWYIYDLADPLLNFREERTSDNSQIRYVTYDYDKNNNATKILETIGDITYTTSFTYNKDNTVASITTNYGEKLEFYYNEKGMPDRTVRKTEDATLYTNYRYNQRGLLTMLEHSKGRYNYNHDQNGNITGIVGPKSSHNYTYDALNQLLSETIQLNGETREIVYTYDKLGNMTTRTEGSNQVQYSYTYDRLTQIRTYQNGVLQNTQNLTYDNAGNVTNDGEYTYTWQMGRQLAGMSKPGLTTSYQYNENGLRTRKTVNDKVHEYIYMGSNVTREVIRNTQGSIIYTIYYSYAGGNSPTSMNVNGVNYYFLKNAQGDITHILDANGAEVGAYEYDAWGNILSVTGGEIAELNPYRYRGYRYDAETGLYYLQSRYYNPEWGRFINADGVSLLQTSIGGLIDTNLFSYCDNNPIIRLDTDGNLWWVAVGAGIGFAVGFIGSAVVQKVTTGRVDIKVAIANGVGGAISGALATTGIGLVGSIAANAAIGSGIYAAEQKIRGDDITVQGVAWSAGAGAICGLIGGSGANGAKLTGIANTSKRVLQTAVSPQKIAMYTAKEAAVWCAVRETTGRYLAGAVAAYCIAGYYNGRTLERE